MEMIHEMLLEDEIFLCGMVMLAGVIMGALTRFMVARQPGRVA